MLSTLFLKKLAKVSGSSSLSISILFRVIFGGRVGLFTLRAVLTASHSDLLFPGIILRLMFVFLMSKKWCLISQLSCLIRSLNKLFGLFFWFFNNFFLNESLRLTFWLGLTGGDFEFFITIFSTGASESTISIMQFSKRFQESWTVSVSISRFFSASACKSFSFE